MKTTVEDICGRWQNNDVGLNVRLNCAVCPVIWTGQSLKFGQARPRPDSGGA